MLKVRYDPKLFAIFRRPKVAHSMPCAAQIKPHLMKVPADG